MLELTQEQLKQTRYNKIKELKTIIKDYGLANKHNKYAFRKNTSLLDKLKKVCGNESGYYREPFSMTKHNLFHKMVDEGSKTLPLIEYKETKTFTPFVVEIKYYAVKCVDIRGKEVTIYEQEVDDMDSIFITLYHILYNKLKNKKRGHTHDDNEYIQRYEAYWLFMLERMDLSKELLEAYHVSP